MQQGSAQDPIEVVAKKSSAVSKEQALEARIEAGKKRLKELQHQRKALARRQKWLVSKEERRLDTRRKILMGSMVQAAIDAGGNEGAELLVKLDAYLTRDDDRALFDMPPVVVDRQRELQREAARAFGRMKAGDAGGEDAFQQAVIAAGGKV